MNQKINIVFFGSSKFVIPIIEVLRNKFDLVLVITTEQNPNGAVPVYCQQNNIECISVSNLSDPTIRYTLDARRSSLGVLAYFGLILPKEILDLFPLGILNVHPSLLPLYRGPTPGQTALFNGDTKTGVTLIKLDEEVDHGQMLTQITEDILSNDTSETLYDRLFKIGAKLLEENIQKYIDGKMQLTEQNHKEASFTDHLTRQSGFIDIANPPSPEKLDSMIRAYYPWPGVWGKLRVQGEKLKVIKFLPEKKLQVEGKKPMNYKDFINGYPQTQKLLEDLGLL